MVEAIPHRMFPHAQERFLGSEEGAGCEPLAHAELWVGLERDLERLQGMLDAAVEQLQRSFSGMSEAMKSDPAGRRQEERLRAHGDRVITCLHFHDVASQMIADMRGRAELLEIAALSAAPRAMVKGRSQLLREALEIPNTRAEVVCNCGGEVDLFQRRAAIPQEPEAPA